MSEISWIAVDWGTSRLRVWAIGDDQTVVDVASSDMGMNGLAPGQFEGALLELVEGWLPPDDQMLVVACGMAGARQGWIEADYVVTPAPPLTSDKFQVAPVTDARLRVLIVPGLAQHEPGDVMRGEETQIAGLLNSYPGFEGAVCMPGTHCKWVEIKAGEVVQFRTCMTGELFSLLEKQSILRHSMQSAELDLEAFNLAVTEALVTENSISADLFSLRADDLLKGVTADVSRARLSARLIASEITALRSFWQGQKVMVLGNDQLAGLYERALTIVGADVDGADGEGLTVVGLIAARAMVGAGL